MSNSLERTLSDEELDKEWESSQRATSPRPQSTMARSFSLALNDLFKIDSSIADLDAAVDQKKKAVSSQTSELEALEARLRATEERLKAVTTSSSLSSSPISLPNRSSYRPRPVLGDTFSSPRDTQKSPLSSEFRPTSASSANARPRSRKEKEETIHQKGLPPTPGQSEGESASDSEGTEEDEAARSAGRHSAKPGLRA